MAIHNALRRFSGHTLAVELLQHAVGFCLKPIEAGEQGLGRALGQGAQDYFIMLLSTLAA